jgi:hypothetical protein
VVIDESKERRPNLVNRPSRSVGTFAIDGIIDARNFVSIYAEYERSG